MWRLALLVLTACGGRPTGDWVGLAPVSADGSEFANRMTISGGGEASGTLYFIAPNTATSQQQLSVFELPFEADWEKDGSTVGFDVTCGDGCGFAMDCELGDTLDCDATPDFYPDDATYLQWGPADG